MTISMIGIDHDRAPVDIRALFAFTKKNAGEAMEKLKETAGIHGCIILSTCNRLEIWASHEDDQELSLHPESEISVLLPDKKDVLQPHGLFLKQNKIHKNHPVYF